jgi:hypothetical protein
MSYIVEYEGECLSEKRRRKLLHSGDGEDAPPQATSLSALSRASSALAPRTLDAILDTQFYLFLSQPSCLLFTRFITTA